MELQINKEDLERAVPAAREPRGKIFNALENYIKAEFAYIENKFLGEAGTRVVEAGTNMSLVREVKNLACLRAFRSHMRSLDLVLTSTGFGVVSTQDTAPASKQRVDALEGELRRSESHVIERLLGELFLVEGWSESIQQQATVSTLFWSFSYLEQYAGISNPKPEDWASNVPVMLEADLYLRKHVGQSYMDELLQQQTSGTLSTDNIPVAVLCRQFIGAWIAQNQRLREQLYARLINTLEADLTKYPAYANGEGYRLNHFTPYENHAEDSAFHFVG